MRDYTLDVQRPRPFGELRRPRRIRLAPHELHPVVRIAHRDTVRHHPGERIILDFELVLLLRGYGRFRLGRQHLPMAPHHVLLVPPFVPHEFLPESPTGNDHIALHFDLAPGVPGPFEDVANRRPYTVELTGAPPFPRHAIIEANGEVESAFHRVLHARASDLPWRELDMARHVMTILSGLLEASRGQRRGRRARVDEVSRLRVEEALAHMRANLARPLRLDDFVQASGVGRSRFIDLFRRHTGHTPQAYLRQLRIAHACTLLTDPNLSVKEIAVRCGFSNQFHFSRTFRAARGVSPSDYRQSFLLTNIDLQRTH